MMTNKEKAVTAATVHGKIIKYSICIVADFKENVKWELLSQNYQDKMEE